MGKYNFRFVDDPNNQNVGLTVEEINLLQEESCLKFPKVYTAFLQNAGKNSNIFQVETNADQLRKIQNELRVELDKLNLLQNENILCIKKYEAYEEYSSINFETYYFLIFLRINGTPHFIFLEKSVLMNYGMLSKKE